VSKSNWQLWKEKQPGDTVRPWDLVNPNIEHVDEATQQHRYNICLSCPSLIQATKQCKKCACFMNQKTKLPHASCPLGKWGEHREAEDVI